MPVTMTMGKPMVSRYGGVLTPSGPSKPYSPNSYNPAGGYKFTPKLSPGIMGNPKVTMSTAEVSRNVQSSSMMPRVAVASTRAASVVQKPCGSAHA